MIADLMLFARPPQLRREQVDVRALLARIADELRSEADAANTRIYVQSPEQPVHISADPVQLAVVIRALCTNAIQAMINGGQIDLRVRRLWEGEAPAEPRSPANEPRGAEITVADNGPGIPPGIRPKIFDPFFSGREAGRGLGFGLSKAWRLVTLHGGTIEVRETAGGGATFVISLPASTEPILAGTR
jgi:signal transduction histidine kinase